MRNCWDNPVDICPCIQMKLLSVVVWRCESWFEPPWISLSTPVMWFQVQERMHHGPLPQPKMGRPITAEKETPSGQAPKLRWEQWESTSPGNGDSRIKGESDTGHWYVPTAHSKSRNSTVKVESKHTFPGCARHEVVNKIPATLAGNWKETVSANARSSFSRCVNVVYYAFLCFSHPGFLVMFHFLQNECQNFWIHIFGGNAQVAVFLFLKEDNPIPVKTRHDTPSVQNPHFWLVKTRETKVIFPPGDPCSLSDRSMFPSDIDFFL